MVHAALRWPRHAARALLLALVLILATSMPARAGWTGYWSWSATTKAWSWTWVWSAPTTGWSVSSTVARGDAACCGLTISNFHAVEPGSVTFSGLLATDFAAELGARTLDLVLRQTSTRDASGVVYRGTGTITSAAVPEPAAALVFSAALCFAGLAHGFGRRRIPLLP